MKAMLTKPELQESLGAARLEARQLLSHSWFRRAWVIQEALLPKEPLVIGASCHCTLYALKCVLLVFSPNLDILTPKEQASLFSLVFMQQWDVPPRLQTGFPFHRILSSLVPALEASIPNDLIYAFLGLQDGNGIQLVPDYQLSLVDTTIMTTRAIINHAQNLAVFDCLYPHESPDPGAIAYPSWVPDFLVFGFSRLLIGFDAADSRRHVSNDQPEDIVDKLLRTHGKVVDQVQVLAQPFPIAVKDLAEFRALIDTMLDKLALNEPSDVAERRLFQAALAEGATTYYYVMGDDQVAAEDGRKQIRGISEMLNSQEEDGEEDWDEGNHLDTTYHRRLIKTTNNRVGMLPTITEKDDLICILHGSSVPIVLRENEDGTTHTVIGQCYLEGVMYGEAVTWEEDEADTFLLK